MIDTFKMRKNTAKTQKAFAGFLALMIAVSMMSSSAVKTSAKSPLSKTSKTLNVGQSFTLSYNGSGAGFASISKPSVASVRQQSVNRWTVSGLKKGTATITVQVRATKYKCKITVKGKGGSKKCYLNAKKMTVHVSTIGIKRSKEAQLKLKNATAKYVKWSSSNAGLVKVDKKGNVKLSNYKTAGSAVISAKYLGKTYTCLVTVKYCGMSDRLQNLVRYSKFRTFTEEIFK